MNPPTAVLSEPTPFRLLIDEAARLSRRHWRRLYPAVAIPMAFLQVIFAVVNIRWMQGLNPLVMDPANDPGAFFTWYLGLWGMIMLIYVVMGLGYSVMGAGAVDVVAGRAPAMGERWRFVFRPRVLITLVGTGVLTLAGMACCFFPGLVVLLLYGLILPVIVEEGQTLGAAFRRSSSLATYNPQKRWGTSPMVKILVLLVVGYLLSFAVSMVVQLPFTLVQQIMIFREAASGADPMAAMMESPWQWLQVPAGLFGSLAQTAVVMYLNLALALLYFDVRNRQEGGDLEAALTQLEGGA